MVALGFFAAGAGPAMQHKKSSTDHTCCTQLVWTSPALNPAALVFFPIADACLRYEPAAFTCTASTALQFCSDLALLTVKATSQNESIQTCMNELRQSRMSSHRRSQALCGATSLKVAKQALLELHKCSMNLRAVSPLFAGCAGFQAQGREH